jgi:hypothetical protein
MGGAQAHTTPGREDSEETEEIRIMHRHRCWTVGVAFAALLVLGACESGTEEPTNGPKEATPRASAEERAVQFVEAIGAFDADQAITYLSDDPSISELVASMGTPGVIGTPEELRLFISLLEAQHYRLMLDSCDEGLATSSGTPVHCTFDYHLFGSDQVGLGPFGGSSIDLTVSGGEIVRASQQWGIDEFSAQVWEPFAQWVSEAYPEDAAVMYADESYTGVSLTEASVQLWQQHVREYTKEAT